MSCVELDDTIFYQSKRTHRGATPANFVGQYRALDSLEVSKSGSLEHFLTERYCLYSADRRGKVYRGEIHHLAWPLQRAEAEVQLNRMTEQIGVSLPDTEPLLHSSKRLEVLAWLPEALTH